MAELTPHPAVEPTWLAGMSSPPPVVSGMPEPDPTLGEGHIQPADLRRLAP